MPKKSGPALKLTEVQDVFDYVLNKAKSLNNRSVEIAHSDLCDLLIGDTAWISAIPNKKEELIKRRDNRIRFKMARKLAEMGVTSHYGNNGYQFSISDEIALDISSNQKAKIHNKIKTTKTYTDYKNTTFFPPTYFPDLIKALESGLNCMITGPKGSGKSRVFEESAAYLGLEQIRFSLGVIRDPADLIGSKEIVEENGASVTKFVPGLLTDCLINGKMAIIDEFDSIEPGITLAINMILEQGTNIICNTEDGPQTFRRHENFRICATANTDGDGTDSMKYFGTKPINPATKDRFRWQHRVGYDLKIERNIVSQWLPDSVVSLLYNEDTDLGKIGIMVKIRESMENNQISDDFGFRPIEDFASNYQIFGWHKSWIYFVLNKFSKDYHDQIVQMIRLQHGNEFAPSLNDFDPTQPDYISDMEQEIKSKGNKYLGVIPE